jgi:hypothetical protein
MFFKPIIARWGIADLAEDLHLPTKNVRRWDDGDSIPADWFAAVVRAANKRAFAEITLEYLAEAAERRRLSRVSEAPTQAVA